MNLIITSLRGIEYSGDIKSLNIRTTSGEITVMDHHRPIVTVLKEGIAHIVDSSGVAKNLAIKSGFLEVAPDNRATALID